MLSSQRLIEKKGREQIINILKINRVLQLSNIDSTNNGKLHYDAIMINHIIIETFC